MRMLLLSWVALAATPLLARATELAPGIELPPGAVLEARVSGDLNGDGIEDHAYVAHNEDSRALTVLLSARQEVDFDYRSEVLTLDLTEFTPASLSLDGNVLKLEDITGGTTAVSSTRRFRYDGRGHRMRLIGLDATVYSRTFAHDGFEASWNLLNGDATTRELRLNRGGGEAAYDAARERSFKRRIRAQWLSDAPDPESVLEEMRDG
jgi:hypothetical protein